MQRRYAAAVLAPFVLGSLAILGGCGGDGGTSSVEPSPEAKKADVGAQDNMRQFMESKSKDKGKGKAKAEAPKATP